MEDIKHQFGDKIASIVEGLTKLSGGVFADKAMKQAENVRKLVLTMSEDIRVMLVKLASAFNIHTGLFISVESVSSLRMTHGFRLHDVALDGIS